MLKNKILNRFLDDKKITLLAILLCLVFGLVAFLSVTGINWKNLKQSGIAITGDEVTYISSGYLSLKTGQNFINPEHPPLIKDISALPLLFLQPVLPDFVETPFVRQAYPYVSFDFSTEGLIKNHQWDYGRLFLFGGNSNTEIIILLARLAVIIFNAVLLFILFLSLRKLWHERVALLSLLLIIILPTSLSHGSLVILDFTSSLLQILAIIWFVIFIQQLTTKKSTISGFLLAILFIVLALLSKATSLVLLPVLFFAGLIYILINSKFRALWWNYLISTVIATILGLILITTYYIPHVYKMDVDMTVQQIEHLLPDNKEYINTGREVVLTFNQGNLFLRALSQYSFTNLLNIRRADLSEQRLLYFMGEIYGLEGVGWRYYPVLFFTKIPLPILLLLPFAGMYFLHNFFKRTNWDLLLSSFVVYSVVFLFLSVYFNLQMGLRYILPVIFIILFITAKFLLDNWDERIFKITTIKNLVTGLIALSIASLIFNFPYYLSYYNLLGGGADNGYKIAVDSNYDWGGQDIKRLAKWVEENNVQTIYTHLFASYDAEYYLGNAYLPYHLIEDPLPVSGSFVAISAHIYQTYLIKDNAIEFTKYFNKDNLVARPAPGFFVFKMP